MPELTTESRNWAMAAHASAAVNQLLLPSFGWIAPGLLWLIKRDDDPEIAFHAAQAFAFQLAMAGTVWVLGALGMAFSCFVVGWLAWIAALVPWAAAIAVPLVGAARVSNGRDWAYPVTGELVERRGRIEGPLE